MITEEKAHLYKTAYFSDEAHGINPNLPKVPVRVVFMEMKYNAFYKQVQPVFVVYLSMEPASFFGYFFAAALKDFVL